GQPESVAPGEWIQVITVPSKVLAYFSSLRSASINIRRREQLRQLVEMAECRRAISYAVHYLSALLNVDLHEMEGIDVFGNAPGLPTTTFWNATELNGLHVDNFCQAPLNARSSIQNRVEINIALGDRYFLFVNLGMVAALRMLRDRGIHFSGCEKSTVAFRTSFMTEFSGYPVVKVRLRPGDAYIAPTEN